jgi:hypothetical protein
VHSVSMVMPFMDTDMERLIRWLLLDETHLDFSRTKIGFSLNF